MAEKFEVLLAEMKAGQEGMEAGQVRMEQVQEEMKDLILTGKKEMRSNIENQVEGIKVHVDECIGRMEEEVQGMKGKIEEVEGEVHMKIEEVKSEVQEQLRDLERRCGVFEIRPNNFPSKSRIHVFLADS
ncbi:hypothetical protein AVEN_146717-1 [Araneus ventricosus]|uniref:Uncharacterized protein n=1 Tax=Araneus ventricosus TaxID=182803 RepID=A0A4Y2QMH6_ARAVE|nr:hypothetical protein AVEN_146717-1 [Araneus ventricosus]